MKQVVTNHIEKIRRADDHVKRWWIIGATTIVMCTIVVLWIAYITATLPQAQLPTNNTDTAQGETKKINPSLFGTMIEGVKVTLNSVWSSFSLFGTRFSEGMQTAINYTTKKKEVIIKNAPSEETPFIPNNPEQLEPTPLP
jgi:hypothetical protein